jgi:hypothetical protein
MSITLDYISGEPVARPVATQIVAATEPLLSSYDWWAEPLNLDIRPADQRLAGSTRIRLSGYGLVDVPDEEEALMVCKDTNFIISRLSEWSAKYKVSWHLSELGMDVGSIVNGKPSSKLSGYVMALCSHLKLPLTKAAEVLKKHEARKE